MKNQIEFGFYPDESYIFAYDIEPYDENDTIMSKCKAMHAKVYQDAKADSESFSKPCFN